MTMLAETDFSYLDDVMRRRKISKTSIFAEIRDGRLKAHKLRRRTIITHEDELAWVRSLPARKVTAKSMTGHRTIYVYEANEADAWLAQSHPEAVQMIRCLPPNPNRLAGLSGIGGTPLSDLQSAYGQGLSNE